MSVENLSSQGKNNRHFIWGVVGLLTGVLLGIVISLNRSSTGNRGNSTSEVDNNGDGKPDATLHYERDLIALGQHDRNFDGKPDYFEWYKDGIVARAESDDDFNGKIDGWLIYRNGNVGLSKQDTDKNGVPDVFQHFEDGVLKMAVWRPNESGKPTRIEFYEKAVKVKELRDVNLDGLLDTALMFDAFENQVREEKLSEPLKAEDVISGVLHKQ